MLVGDPDFTTPPAVLDVALKAMQDGLTHYRRSRGYPDLRIAVASKLTRDEGIHYNPASEILISHGSIHANYLAAPAGVIGNVLKARQNSITCVAPFIQ